MNFNTANPSSIDAMYLPSMLANIAEAMVSISKRIHVVITVLFILKN